MPAVCFHLVVTITNKTLQKKIVFESTENNLQYLSTQQMYWAEYTAHDEMFYSDKPIFLNVITYFQIHCEGTKL